MDAGTFWKYFNMFVEGIGETLYMTGVSTLMAYVIGLPLGVILHITDSEGIRPNRWINTILGAVVNIIRSIPFVILIIAVIPVTMAIVHTTLGATATIVPLVIGAAPFVARMVESSLFCGCYKN